MSWRIVLEARKQQMILPDPVDAQILPRIALAQKAAPLEQTDRSRIGLDAGRLDPVQAQRLEAKGQHGFDGGGHVAIPCETHAQPIADAAGLSDAAADIREREAAEQQ